MQTVTLETITPQLALQYLEHNKNRNLQEGYAQRLAKMMVDGEWQLTHQGIAFNCDGSLRDGQHRLRAVVLSGIPQQFWVARGVSEAAVMVMDTHKIRNEADAFTLAGFPTHQRVVSMCRSAYFGMKSQGEAISRDKLFAFMQRHQHAIEFVVSRAAAKWPFPAVVLAPVLRAYYSADHGRLGEFLKIMFGGTPQGEADSAANALRNFLLLRRGSGTGMRAELYRKCEASLRAFLEYRPLAKLYASSSEEFPLPEEGV